MKRFVLLLLCYAIALVGAMLIAGCASAPVSPVQAIVEAAVADGQVTPAEVDQIRAALPSRTDWSEILLVGSSILGSILGVKILPGSALRGPWDRPQPPQPS